MFAVWGLTMLRFPGPPAETAEIHIYMNSADMCET